MYNTGLQLFLLLTIYRLYNNKISNKNLSVSIIKFKEKYIKPFTKKVLH